MNFYHPSCYSTLSQREGNRRKALRSGTFLQKTVNIFCVKYTNMIILFTYVISVASMS